jgi:uncharacterized membrane-anchored protein
MLERLTHLSENTRLIVMAVGMVAILIIVNSQIAIKQGIIDNGSMMLLRLAPRDPRSLLQGDYMALRYAMATQVAQAAKAAQMTDGRIVVELTSNGEASFAGLYQGQALSQGQRLLNFRKRGDSVRLASDAYFFAEGQWKTYANARYGELRVSEDGEAVLTGLRDDNGNRLGHALHQGG